MLILLEESKMEKIIRSIVKKIPGIRQFVTYIRRKREPLVEDIVKQVFGNSAVRFVQVGSNDGLHNDPIFSMSSSSELWTGILIEPVPYLFERLKANYKNSTRFIFENVAIGRNSDKKPFYYVSEHARTALGNLPVWHDQLGSFDKNHILNHEIPQIESFIEVMDVKIFTLPDILIRNRWQNIDLLHVDAEGYDWEILSGIDLSILTPKMIIIEHTHLSVEDRNLAKQKMINAGYRVRKLGGDFCAIRSGDFGQVEAKTWQGSGSHELAQSAGAGKFS